MPSELYKPEMLKLWDKWREQFNPLERLQLRTIIGWLYLQQLGAVADITWLYEFFERRNPTLMACVQRRTAAMEKLDWDIKVTPEDELPKGATKAMADKQRQFLFEAYNRLDNLRDAINWRALAAFRGFAHLEKHYDAKGNVIHLEPVPQWNWARAGKTGLWFYNQRALSIYANPDALDGQLTEIDPEDFIIGEVAYPIDEAIVGGIFRSFGAQKDWDAFLASFGIPSVFVELPPNAPVDNDGNVKSDYQRQAESVVNNSRGVTPSGSKVTAFDASGRGRNPFLEHMKYQAELIVLAATGGKLTMLAESGSGTLSGGAHKDTFDEIAEADAMRISEDFNRQFDVPLLAKAFPDQPVLAKFALEGKELSDASAVAKDVLAFANAGYAVDIDQIEQKTGYRLTLRDPVSKTAIRADQGDASIKPDATNDLALSNRFRAFLNRFVPKRWLRNRADTTQANELVKAIGLHIGAASDKALEPITNRINALVDGPDADFEAGSRKLIADIPALVRKAGGDEKAVAAWQNGLGTILLNGLTEPVGKAAQ